MGSRKGKPNKLTAAVKDRIEQAFNVVNGPHNSGLIRLAEEHPAIFYSLVAKLIPAQTTVALTVVALDLGKAMLDNQRFLDAHRLNTSTIDVTPDKPTKLLIPKEK